MDYYPKLSFVLDKNLDKWTCNKFLVYKEFSNFSQAILHTHPDLDTVKVEKEDIRKKHIDLYVEKYYMLHEPEINLAIDKMKSDWESVSKSLYKKVIKLFSDAGESAYEWPKGNYTGKLSIFNCNPRWIETKTFQVFYMKSSGTNHTCMHEMLHFAFYDYIDKHFANECQKIGDKAVWKMTEVFNDVILRQPEFTILTGRENPGIYAETQEELTKNLDLWKKSIGVKEFVRKYTESLV